LWDRTFRVDIPTGFPLPFPTMLTIPLARLEREGALEVQAAIPPDDPSWDGTELRFSTPLSISGQARWLTSGEVLVRVSLRAGLSQECRRCLEPVEAPLEEELVLLFVPPGGIEEQDDEVRSLPQGMVELDLREVIREEVILAQRPYVLCRPECRGLCPACGANLNEETCQCSSEELDPRWDALRALNEERD
jgi:uncharacterized protein